MTKHDIRDMAWTDIKRKVKSKITVAIKKKETKEQKMEQRLRLKKKQDGEISSSQKMVPKLKSFFFTSALYYLNKTYKNVENFPHLQQLKF